MVLVLVCLCVDTPIWARIAFSLSLFSGGVHRRLRLRLCGQGLPSRSPWFGAGVHSCRGAETAPLVCLFSRPQRLSSCSPLTKCSTIWLCIPAGSSGAVVENTVYIPQLHLVLGCRRGEDGRDPTVATSVLDTVAHMPVVSQRQVPGMVETVRQVQSVSRQSRSSSSYSCLDNVVLCPLCATTYAWWFRVHITATVAQLQCSDTVSGDFFGPCTQVQGWESCPQGHGSHNEVHACQIPVGRRHIQCPLAKGATTPLVGQTRAAVGRDGPG